MSRRLAIVLAVTAVVLAAGIVVGARAVTGGRDKKTQSLHHAAHKMVSQKNALAEGYRLAAVVNYRSWQLHKKMWITPVHCAADTPHLFACSFQSTNPDVCRFVRFFDDHGNMEIRLAGLVPTTFCKGGKRVAVE